MAQVFLGQGAGDKIFRERGIIEIVGKEERGLGRQHGRVHAAQVGPDANRVPLAERAQVQAWRVRLGGRRRRAPPRAVQGEQAAVDRVGDVDNRRLAEARALGGGGAGRDEEGRDRRLVGVAARAVRPHRGPQVDRRDDVARDEHKVGRQVV